MEALLRITLANPKLTCAHKQSRWSQVSDEDSPIGNAGRHTSICCLYDFPSILIAFFMEYHKGKCFPDKQSEHLARCERSPRCLTSRYLVQH